MSESDHITGNVIRVARKNKRFVSLSASQPIVQHLIVSRLLAHISAYEPTQARQKIIELNEP